MMRNCKEYPLRDSVEGAEHVFHCYSCFFVEQGPVSNVVCYQGHISLGRKSVLITEKMFQSACVASPTEAIIQSLLRAQFGASHLHSAGSTNNRRTLLLDRLEAEAQRAYPDFRRIYDPPVR